MQDFHSIPGLIFGGVAGGVELRRLGGAQEAPPPAAKCPRCESSNTKFCYYNNYNLAQPRHFCRACRRYWTKGGVLRNVPVGGGCRKSSTSKKPSKNRRRPSPASRSSSDSSSLAAAAATDTSASSTNPNPSPNLDPVEGSDPAPPPPPPPPPPVMPDIYSGMGTFTSLMEAASGAPAFLGFGFSDPPPLLQRTGAAEDLVNVDLQQPTERRVSGGGGGLGWSGAAEQPAFDFACGADPAAYWNPGQWDDADPSSLFLP